MIGGATATMTNTMLIDNIAEGGSGTADSGGFGDGGGIEDTGGSGNISSSLTLSHCILIDNQSHRWCRGQWGSER